MPVRCSYSTTANRWLPKPSTILAAALLSSLVQSVSSPYCRKKAASSCSSAAYTIGTIAPALLLLLLPLLLQPPSPSARATAKYRTRRFSAKKVWSWHMYYRARPS